MALSSLKSKSLLLSMLGVVILIVGIVIVVLLMPEPQDTRRQAAVQGGTAKFSISPSQMDLDPEEKKTATVAFSPEGATIAAVSVRLKFPVDSDNPAIEADNLVITTQAAAHFRCNPQSITTVNDETFIDVSCSTSGTNHYTATSFIDLFTFDVIAGEEATKSPVTIAFDAQKTVVTAAITEEERTAPDIAAIPTGSLRVSVEEPPDMTKTTELDYDVSCESDQVTAEAILKEGGNEKGDVKVKFTYNNVTKEDITDEDGVATANLPKAGEDLKLEAIPEGGYPSKSVTVILPTNCPTGNTTPTPTPTASPTAGGTNDTTGAICSASCVVSRDCAGTLTCINGVCRDERCPNDQTCQCASTDPTTGTGDTELPETGFDQTMLMTILGVIFILGGSGLFFTFAPLKTQE